MSNVVAFPTKPEWRVCTWSERQANHQHEWVTKGFWNIATWKDCECGAEAWPASAFTELDAKQERS